MYALMAGQPSPVPDWQKWFDKPEDANTLVWPGTRANSFHIQVTDLCSEMESVVSSTHKREDFYAETIRIKEAALHLQRSVLQWPCDGSKFQPRFVKAAQTFDDDMEYFRDFHTFRHWSFFRGTMIVLHESLLRFDQRMKSITQGPSSTDLGLMVLSDVEHACCTGIIAGMASQVLGTLPFLFGNVNSTGQVRSLADGESWSERSRHAHMGGLALWLLRMIKTSEYTSGAQKHKATAALLKIGRTMGVRQALTIPAMWS